MKDNQVIPLKDKEKDCKVLNGQGICTRAIGECECPACKTFKEDHIIGIVKKEEEKD